MTDTATLVSRGTIDLHATPVHSTYDQIIAHQGDSTEDFNVLVTEVLMSDPETYPWAVGRIGTAFISRGYGVPDRLIARPTNDAGRTVSLYARGALVNPTLENGKCYRIVDSLLVQYWDDEHADRRNSATVPFDVVAGPTGPWEFPNDSIGAIPPEVNYFEVVPPEGAKPIDLTAVTEAEPEDATVPAEVPVATESALLKALVLLDEHGAPVLMTPEEFKAESTGGAEGPSRLMWLGDNPERVSVVRAYGDNEIYRTQTLGLSGTGEVQADVGHAMSRWTYWSDTTDNLRIGKPAEVEITRPAELNADQARLLERLRQRNTRHVEQWESMGEKLNEMAEENDWCSEYEDAVQPLGWDGREDKRRDWDVDVTVDFTFEDNSPSSHVDNTLSSLFDLNGATLNEVRIVGQTTVTVRKEGYTDGDDASENVTLSDVEEAFEISGATIDDWSCGDIEECDD